VVLAGGVADGVALRAAIVLGCDLAYMGTRFIATSRTSRRRATRTCWCRRRSTTSYCRARHRSRNELLPLRRIGGNGRNRRGVAGRERRRRIGERAEALENLVMATPWRKYGMFGRGDL
jgi:hypothetical protein